MNIGYSDIDMRKVLTNGHTRLDQAHSLKEEAHKGKLRAGNAGCITAAGIKGECHRISHLRQIGIDKKHDLPRKLMFQAGYANEDSWSDVTIAGWQGQVLRHTEVEKQGSWGTVMGHPDIVLADAAGAWQVVLELKLLSALWTTTQRTCYGNPDEKHLIQSAVYMWLTGQPVILCYTNRCDFAVQFDRKKLGIEKIEPCYAMFYLKIVNGRLCWRHEFGYEDVETDITIEGIVAYYQMVADIAFNYQLGERPLTSGFNRCDPKYCVFSGVCDDWERDYVTWRNEARAAV